MATLREVMTTDVCTVEPDETIASVALAMMKGRFGSVIVQHGSMITGILTERDVLRAASRAADMTTARVSDWMTPEPRTASPDLDTDEAADLMLSNGFRHLQVVDDSGLVGIISLRDVLSARIRR